MFKNEGGGGGVKGRLNNVKKKQTIWLGRASLKGSLGQCSHELPTILAVSPNSIHTDCHFFAKVTRRGPKWRRWMRTQRQEVGRSKTTRCFGPRRGLIAAAWNVKPLQLVPYPIKPLQSPVWEELDLATSTIL